MSKLPWCKFYHADWTLDLQDHPLEMEGAWIRICCRIYHSGEMGTLTKTLPEWGRIFDMDEANTIRILRYLQKKKICDVLPCLTEFLPDSKHGITVVSRRIEKEEKEKESNRIKSNRSYAKNKKTAKREAVLPGSDHDFTGRYQISELEEDKNPPFNSPQGENKKRKKFVRPTIEEIRTYCQERGNKIGPEKFFDFYESKGWVVGKSSMKDWKAAIRTWEQKQKEQENTPPKPRTYREHQDAERRGTVGRIKQLEAELAGQKISGTPHGTDEFAPGSAKALE